MPRKRKFRPGPVIPHVVVLVAALDTDTWIYWKGRPKHPTFLANLPYQVLRTAVRRGRLRIAVPNDEEGDAIAAALEDGLARAAEEAIPT